MILMPVSIRGHFRNLEIPSPVVGELGGLIQESIHPFLSARM